MCEHTPDYVINLPENGVFVFGSNRDGAHAGGAARLAQQRFGAVWGEGEGLHGRSYALPTMEGWSSFEAAAARFLAFAGEHPELKFYLTKVGCGIAGYSPEDVAPLFANAPENVVKPVEFEAGDYEPEKRQAVMASLRPNHDLDLVEHFRTTAAIEGGGGA